VIRVGRENAEPSGIARGGGTLGEEEWIVGPLVGELGHGGKHPKVRGRA